MESHVKIMAWSNYIWTLYVFFSSVTWACTLLLAKGLSHTEHYNFRPEITINQLILLMRAQWPFQMYSLRNKDEQNANDFHVGHRNLSLHEPYCTLTHILDNKPSQLCVYLTFDLKKNWVLFQLWTLCHNISTKMNWENNNDTSLY